MPENIERSRGKAGNYKMDKGGAPVDVGAFIGTVVNNIDPSRQGRIQVFIEQFSGSDPADKSQWRTLSYCPPFYGATPKSGTSQGTGTYPGNQSAYGMWFTAPDLGTQVLCFFVNGDPSQGYYLGCVPEQGQVRMLPAIGAVTNYVPQNKNQETYFTDDPRLPVTEINNAPTNVENVENPKFFDVNKPVHSYLASVLFQQGLNKDTIRGSIGSSAQRESPSGVFGFSSPGRAIYQGGANEDNIRQELNSNNTSVADVKVIGRRGGHTFVMDDGDLEGKDNLVRIRTAKGHQLTMSDDGNSFYITHANGLTWIELGEEGTIDFFATNSVNIRSQGTINLHADEDINMFAGKKINLKSMDNFTLQSDKNVNIATKTGITLYSDAAIGIKSNGSLGLVSTGGAWDGGGSLSLSAGAIDLNGGPKIAVQTPPGLTKYLLPDTTFNNSTGWEILPTGLESIVTRAPTHEPYPYHGKGVPVSVSLQKGQTSASPASPAVPNNWSITRK